jgi:hypothetical protein
MAKKRRWTMVPPPPKKRVSVKERLAWGLAGLPPELGIIVLILGFVVLVFWSAYRPDDLDRLVAKLFASRKDG